MDDSDENLPVAESILEDFDKNKAEKDYEYSRSVSYDLIEKGRDAIEMMFEVARETEHPRAYEVLGKLIKDTSDINDKLIDHTKKYNDLTGQTEEKKGGVTNNNLFVGSTPELQKMIADLSKQEDIVDVTPIENDKKNTK